MIEYKKMRSSRLLCRLLPAYTHWHDSCFKCRNPVNRWVLYFGRETQSGPNVNEVSRTVSQVITHPDYSNTTFNNDVALMRLSTPVTFTDYIRPICLASNSSQFYNSTLCWATGWGRLGREGEYPLFHQLVPVAAAETYRQRYCLGTCDTWNLNFFSVLVWTLIKLSLLISLVLDLSNFSPLIRFFINILTNSRITNNE